MDRFIETTPFFSSDHRTLAARMAEFAEREVEVRAGDDEGDVDEALRGYVLLLAEADLLRYAVAAAGHAFDLRSFCIIRETLSYSSSLADLAFVMQGLGTYAISLAATEHVRDFWLARAANGKAIAAFALTEPDAGSDVAAIKTLVDWGASTGELVPCPAEELAERLDQFWVVADLDQILGVCALRPVAENLAELCSLAVWPEWQRHGTGPPARQGVP